METQKFVLEILPEPVEDGVSVGTSSKHLEGNDPLQDPQDDPLHQTPEHDQASSGSLACEDDAHTVAEDQSIPANATTETHELLNALTNNHPVTLSLAKSVIQELRMQPAPGGRFRNKSHDESSLGGSTMFLVTEKEIQNIIDKGLEKWTKRISNGRSFEPRPESPSSRTRESSVVSLDAHGKGIQPRPPSVLDPATTISVPKTSFSKSSVHGNKRGRNRARDGDLSMTATILSRRSVAEITWTRDGGHLGEWSDSDRDPDDIPNSNHSSRTRSSSASSLPIMGYAKNTRASLQGYSIYDHVISGNIVYHSPQSTPSQGLPKTDNVSSNAAPSSRRRSQHCNVEWATPMAWTSERDRTMSDDMYDFGIDAHCGSASRRHTLFSEESLHRRWTTNQSIFDIPSHGRNDDETWLVRRSTLALPSVTRTDNFGNMIGSSCRTRSVPGFYAAGDSRKRGSEPSLLERVMSTGQHFVNGAFGYKGPGDDNYHDDGFGALAPTNSPSGGRGSARESPFRGGSHFQSPSPPSSLEEHNRLNSILADERRRHMCSEDSRPHVCENDMDNLKARE